MSPEQVTLFIAAVAAILACAQGLRNQYAIREVHVAMNSRMTELLERSTTAAELAGRAAQRADDNSRAQLDVLSREGHVDPQ